MSIDVVGTLRQPADEACAATLLSGTQEAILRVYQERMAERYRWVRIAHLAALGEEWQLARIGRLRLFVEPRVVRKQGVSPFDGETLSRVLADRGQKLSVLLGGQGAGKSEVINWLIASLCTPGCAPSGLPGDLIPVRIDLRAFDVARVDSGEAQPPDLIVFVAQSIFRTESIRLDAEILQLLAQQGRLLLCFDGLDEVPNRGRQVEYVRSILRLCSDVPARAILTSRPTGAASWLHELGDAPVYTLRSFDDEQVRAFVAAWHEQAFSVRPEAGRQRSQRLAKALSEDHALRELCRNPLMLCLVSLVNRGEHLPRRRHKVLARAVELMVSQWEDSKRSDEGSKPLSEMPQFKKEEKINFLRHLAWDLLCGRLPSSAGSQIYYEDLMSFARSFGRDQRRLPEDELQEYAVQIVGHLERRSAILEQVDDTHYGFVHQAFPAFLAAQVLSRCPRSQQEEYFCDRWAVDSWREVLTCCCGLLGEDRPDRVWTLLIAVLKDISPFDLSRCLRYDAFAVRCMAEQHKLAAEPLQQGARQLMHLIQADLLSPGCSPGAEEQVAALVQAMSHFGPRWPEAQSWVEWGSIDAWAELHSEARRIAMISCVLSTCEKSHRVSRLMALLRDSMPGTLVEAAIGQAGELGPWELAEITAIGRRYEHAAPAMQDSVALGLKKRLGDDEMVSLLDAADLPPGFRLSLVKAHTLDEQLPSERLSAAMWELCLSVAEQGPLDLQERAIYSLGFWLERRRISVSQRQALTQLLQAVRDRRASLWLAGSLVSSGNAALGMPVLLAHQESNDPELLTLLIPPLSRIERTRDLAKALLHRLLAHPDHCARALVLFAGLFPDEGTEKLLGSYLSHPAPEVRRSAALLLANLSKARSVLDHCIDTLLDIGDPVPDTVIQLKRRLTNPSKDSAIQDKLRLVNTERKQLILSICLFDKLADSVAILKQLAQDAKQTDYRLAAASLVEDFGVIEALVLSRPERDPYMRWVHWLVQNASSQPHRQKLLAVATNAPFERARLMAAFALSATEPGAPPPLELRVSWRPDMMFDWRDLPQRDIGPVPAQSDPELAAVAEVLRELATMAQDERVLVQAAAWLSMRATLERAADDSMDPWVRAYSHTTLFLLKSRESMFNHPQNGPLKSSDPHSPPPPSHPPAQLPLEIALRRHRDRSLDTETLVRRFGGALELQPSSPGRLLLKWSGAQVDALVRAAETGQLDEQVLACGMRYVDWICRDKEWLYERLYEKKLAQPPCKDVDSALLRKHSGIIDVGILTTTLVERRAVLSMMQPLPGTEAILTGSLDASSFRLGAFGRYRAVHFESTMGTQGRSGAILTVNDAIKEWRLKAVIVIGIGFGVDRRKQRLGDVLIAEAVQPYELQRVGETGIIHRGIQTPCGGTLSDRFRSRSDGWRIERVNKEPVRIHQGLLLSGEKLVDKQAFRDQLVGAFPIAIGGDMEGAGAYAAADRRSAEIILVKSICDWADGHKNDRAQPFAAFTAVSLAHHVLSKPGVLEAIGAVDIL